MILNIKLPHRHKFTVMYETLDEFGAEFVCTKCLKKEFMVHNYMQRISARVILSIREADRIIDRLGE